MNLSAALSAACFAVFGLHIPAYAVIAIAGMLAALWLSLRTAPLRSLEPETLWDAGVFAIAAAFVLSRLLGLALFVVVEHGQLTLSLRDILSFSSISYLSLRRHCDPRPPVAALEAPSAAARDGRLGALRRSAVERALARRRSLRHRRRPSHATSLGYACREFSAGTRVHPVALYTAAAALALCGTLFALLRRMRESRPRRRHRPSSPAAQFVFLLDMLRVPEPAALA